MASASVDDDALKLNYCADFACNDRIISIFLFDERIVKRENIFPA
jgi:hypothetical protein